jgi:hypothetical protein
MILWTLAALITHKCRLSLTSGRCLVGHVACFQVFGTLDPFGSCLAVTQLEVSGAFVEDGVGGVMMSCGWWLLKIGPKIGSKPALN